MAGWLWLLGLVVGLTAVQLLVYRRLQDRTGGPPTADGDGGAVGGLGFDPPARPPASGSGDARSCPHCGAENDPEPAYTYCGHCVRPLN